MEISTQKQSIFLNPIFWIISFFIIRLYGIWLPPLEMAHNWRQTTVLMAARNFLEVDNNILYPRVDFAGEESGITGMEFPILNYLIFLVAKVFGYQHWFGRLINLIVTSIGCYYFFLLIKKYIAEEIALFSTIILLASQWFILGRKIMPDTFASSILIISIYYGFDYFYESRNKLRNLILYFLCAGIGVLSKLPVGYFLLIFAFPIFDKRIVLLSKIKFGIASAIMMIPIMWWYFLWVPHLVESFRFYHFFMGEHLGTGVQQILANLIPTFNRFSGDAIKYTGFIFFLVGLFFAFKNRNKKILFVFAILFFGFCLIVFKSGRTFYHHTYYIAPFIPVMGLVAGYFLSEVKNSRIKWVFVSLYLIECFANYYIDFRINPNEKEIAKLEQILDVFSNREDKIVINSGNNPTPMYFSHRKGWVCFNDYLKDRDYMTILRENNCKYIVIIKKGFGSDISLNYKKVYFSYIIDVYKIQ